MRRKTGAGYTVTYDRRGLTATIAKGGDTASLAYASDGHRYELTVDGKTTLYLMGGAFRVVETAGGVTAYRQAIVAGGRMVAQQVTKSNAASGFEYFYHDGLGSPVAFASSAGAGVAPGVAYGPYGRARSATNWATLDTGNPLTAYGTRRGYTGGESLAAMGVVVLGARVYIPALGRWLSPDPAGASSSPYVYAGDNPESDIDPTGALDWNSVGKIFEAAAVAFASFYTAGAVEAVYGPVAGGAAGGFVGGFAGSGGNLEDGAIGALGGAAMGYFGDVAFGGEDATAGQLAERATVEGLVGGTLSAVVEHGRGGSFESGFLGAFAAALIGGGIAPRSSSAEVIAARTAAMTVVGGTVAEIGGGSFANGAISAAFQQLFNQVLRALAIPSVMVQTHAENSDIPAGGYKTNEAAAKAALIIAAPKTEKSGYEYGGAIIKTKSGQYLYTNAVTIYSSKHFEFRGIEGAPSGATLAGLYHVHPRGAPLPYVFSVNDVNVATHLNVVSYIATPNKDIRYYNPAVMHPVGPFNYSGLPVGTSPGAMLCDNCVP